MNEAGSKLSEQIQRFFFNKIKFMMYNFQGFALYSFQDLANKANKFK
jgi:hypothetical protein